MCMHSRHLSAWDVPRIRSIHVKLCCCSTFHGLCDIRFVGVQEESSVKGFARTSYNANLVLASSTIDLSKLHAVVDHRCICPRFLCYCDFSRSCLMHFEASHGRATGSCMISATRRLLDIGAMLVDHHMVASSCSI